VSGPFAQRQRGGAAPLQLNRSDEASEASRDLLDYLIDAAWIETLRTLRNADAPDP